MQVIYKDEDERSSSRRADLVYIVICVRRFSRHVERKYTRRFGSRFIII